MKTEEYAGGGWDDGPSGDLLVATSGQDIQPSLCLRSTTSSYSIGIKLCFRCPERRRQNSLAKTHSRQRKTFGRQMSGTRHSFWVPPWYVLKIWTRIPSAYICVCVCVRAFFFLDPACMHGYTSNGAEYVRPWINDVSRKLCKSLLFM